MDDKTRTDLEAAAFRRLVAHLQERTDVQNIDLMNLAGFCRNCLSRWYREEAGKQGIEIADPKAREIVYGMPYDDWKAKHQKEASGDQKKAFDKAQPDDNRHCDGKDRQEDAACRSGKFHVNSILVNSIPGQTRCVGSATYKMS